MTPEQKHAVEILAEVVQSLCMGGCETLTADIQWLLNNDDEMTQAILRRYNCKK